MWKKHEWSVIDRPSEYPVSLHFVHRLCRQTDRHTDRQK